MKRRPVERTDAAKAAAYAAARSAATAQYHHVRNIDAATAKIEEFSYMVRMLVDTMLSHS
jgi:hypothetical protein